MRIIYWVQCILREGFVLGGLTWIHFWKSVKGGHHLSKKKPMYLKLFDEKKIQKKVALQNFLGGLGDAIIVFFVTLSIFVKKMDFHLKL